MNWALLAISVAMAELPDIDFLFGFLTNEPNKYHHGFTHSFMFVIVIGLLVAVVTSWRNRSQFGRHALLFTGAGISHIVLDSLAKDTTPPYGAPIFWPFTDKFYISPVIVFSDMHRASDSARFFPSMFTLHNLMTVTREVLILLPLIVLIYVLNKRRRAA